MNIPRTKINYFCLLALNLTEFGTSLGVQWLRLCASTAGDAGLIPGRGTKIPHAMQRGQKIKKTKHLTELPGSLQQKILFNQ